MVSLCITAGFLFIMLDQAAHSIITTLWAGFEIQLYSISPLMNMYPRGNQLIARITVETSPKISISTAAETPIPSIATMVTTLCQRGMAFARYRPMFWMRTPTGSSGNNTGRGCATMSHSERERQPVEGAKPGGRRTASATIRSSGRIRRR